MMEMMEKRNSNLAAVHFYLIPYLLFNPIIIMEKINVICIFRHPTCTLFIFTVVYTLSHQRDLNNFFSFYLVQGLEKTHRPSNVLPPVQSKPWVLNTF